MNQYGKNTVAYATLYENSFLLIAHAPSHHAIFCRLTGYQEEQNALFFFEKIIKIVEEKKAQNLVAELQDFKGSQLNLAKYASQVWVQKLANRGIKKIAFTTPKSKFGQFIVKIAAGRETHDFVKVGQFAKLYQAFSWLEEDEG